MAERATAALKERSELRLVDLVLAECVYVLESFYELSRPRIAELMRAALALPSISVDDEALALRSLELYEIERLDFAEAYLVACAEGCDAATVMSFDRTIDRVAGLSRIEP